jgi:hypothetical protein
MEALGEHRKLISPVGAVAADAVQEHQQRTCAHVVDRDARGRTDEFRLDAVHIVAF